MNESWNPEIPLDLQQNFKKRKRTGIYTIFRFCSGCDGIYVYRISSSILCSCTFFRVPCQNMKYIRRLDSH